MEPVSGPVSRVRLILGKYRVIERGDGYMKLAMGGSTTMTCSVEPYMDVREGDLLTLYTEVLFNAQSIQASKQ